MRIENREEKLKQVRENIKHGDNWFTWLPEEYSGPIKGAGHGQQISFTTVEERLLTIEHELKIDYAKIQKKINKEFENMPLEVVLRLCGGNHPFKEDLIRVMEEKQSQKQEDRIKELEEENKRLKAMEKQNENYN